MLSDLNQPVGLYTAGKISVLSLWPSVSSVPLWSNAEKTRIG